MLWRSNCVRLYVQGKCIPEALRHISWCQPSPPNNYIGCALLVDESEETYCWVLETFLEAMKQKVPVSVLTVGDMAMRNAIEKCFPNARHRLCSWHLHKNSMTNVHIEGFCSEFKKCMAMWYSADEFEEAWKHMVEHYGLHNNKWVAETYAKRTMWAEAHLRGQFFAGMRSTQRCEGMNAFFNKYLQSKLMLFEFVRHFDRALTRFRQREVKANLESNTTSPVMTTPLNSLEKHAAEIYTKSSFQRFRLELKNETLYSVVERVHNESSRTYKLSKNCDKHSSNVVTFHEVAKKLECSCHRFESNGIPCRHMLQCSRLRVCKKFQNVVSIGGGAKMRRVGTKNQKLMKTLQMSPTLCDMVH